MAIDDVAVLRLVGKFQEQNIVNTMHYKVTSQEGGDAGLWQELVEAWLTTFETAWLARHLDSYELVGVKAFTVKGDTRPPGEETVGNPGVVVDDPVFAFVCRTITFYSNDPNPRRRGRLMLSGGGDLMFTASRGAVAAGEIALLTTLGEALLGEVTGPDNTYVPVLYQKLPETVTTLLAAKGRVTPSTIRSRRVRKFLIG